MMQFEMQLTGQLRCRGREKSCEVGGRTGRRRQPCQPSWPGAQLVTASWRGIGMSGDGDSLVVVVSCCSAVGKLNSDTRICLRARCFPLPRVSHVSVRANATLKWAKRLRHVRLHLVGLTLYCNFIHRGCGLRVEAWQWPCSLLHQADGWT